MNPMRHFNHKLLALLFSIILVESAHCQVLHWVQTNNPPTIANGLVPYGKSLFAPTLKGLFVSTDSGTTWAAVKGFLGTSDILSCYVRDTILFATTSRTSGPTDGNPQFKSTNGGITWDSAGGIGAGESIFWSKTMEVVGGFILDNSYSLYYNHGKSSRWLDSAFPGQIRSAVPGDSLLLVLTDSVYIPGKHEHLMLSSDFGNSWQYLDIFDSSIFPFTAIGDTFFAYTKTGLFRSLAKVSSWRNIYDDTSIRLRTLINDTLFATTKKSGIIISPNQGNSWSTTMNIGLPSFDFTDFVIGNHNIYVEFPSGDIFRTTYPAISKVEVTAAFSEQRLIIQPNPLSASCEIFYSLPSRGIVSLIIYDALGRIVAQPISETVQDIGEHNVSIDLGHLNSGIYQCRLTFENNEKVAKMVVVH